MISTDAFGTFPTNRSQAIIESEVTNVDPREKRIGLSVKALRKSEERADMEAYLSRDRDSGKFTFADVMPEAEKTKG